MTPVKFLSDGWAKQVKDALNDDEAFKQGTAGQRAKIQQVITGPEGETRYWISIDDGTIDLGMGDIDSPDVTIAQDRDTAVGMARSEISAVSAFMTGKLRVTGSMTLLMSLQAAFGRLPAVMQELDVEY